MLAMSVADGAKIRLDIQGLRAISIISVIVFHLWRREFPLGHLGVDIFFCISGYLMFSIMSRSGSISVSSILDFYFRRLKRIMPTYLFVVFIVLVSVYLWLPPTEFKDVAKDAKVSLLFASNLMRNRQNSYFGSRITRHRDNSSH